MTSGRRNENAVMERGGGGGGRDDQVVVHIFIHLPAPVVACTRRSLPVRAAGIVCR